MHVLLLTTSPRGDASLSTRLATEVAQKFVGGNGRAPQLTVRDLAQEPLPHIDPGFVHAAHTPEAGRTDAQRAALARSDRLIEELKAADVLVIGAGMINFSVPSTLKAWIDHVVRAGVTFRYGESGPEGLVTGKKVVLVLAKGGVYSAGPYQTMDHLEPYLRDTLRFLGMTDVEVIPIEGVALGQEAAEKAVAQAHERAGALTAAVAA